MNTQSFVKNNDFRMETFWQETSKAQNLEIEKDFIKECIQKGSFENNQAFKTSFSLKNESHSLLQKKELPISISKVFKGQSVAQEIFLSLEKPTLKGISDQTLKKTTEIREAQLVEYPSINLDWYFQSSKNHQLRGGCTQADNGNHPEIKYLELLSKFQKYQEQVLNDMTLKRELNLYVDVLVSSHFVGCNNGKRNNGSESREREFLEHTFDIYKHFLMCESTEAPKILLLTGQAGVGKSLFCKHLQREIMSNWIKTTQADHRNWFPIYVKLPSLNNPKSAAIVETLTRELSLTKEEALLLQNSEQNNLQLPHLLFIFDGYEDITDTQAFYSTNSEQDLVEKNFFNLQGSSWRNAKFIVTCREENLQQVLRRDRFSSLLISNDTNELSAVSESFLQRKIEPFTDEQITHYLKKYCCYEPFDQNEKRRVPCSLAFELVQVSQLSTSSWDKVREFEKMIDNYQLRELARIPFML